MRSKFIFRIKYFRTLSYILSVLLRLWFSYVHWSTLHGTTKVTDSRTAMFFECTQHCRDITLLEFDYGKVTIWIRLIVIYSWLNLILFGSFHPFSSFKVTPTNGKCWVEDNWGRVYQFMDRMPSYERKREFERVPYLCTNIGQYIHHRTILKCQKQWAIPDNNDPPL